MKNYLKLYGMSMKIIWNEYENHMKNRYLIEISNGKIYKSNIELFGKNT